MENEINGVLRCGSVCVLDAADFLKRGSQTTSLSVVADGFGDSKETIESRNKIMDINEALEVLRSNMKSHVVELHGEKGERGERGLTGPAGRDGKDVRLVIGKVVAGSEAVARIRQEGNTFILDLCLPCGEQGQRGHQGLPGKDGEQGPAGVKGESGSRGERGERGERGVEGPRGERGTVGERGPQGTTGPAGESVVGPKGEPGRSIDEDQLKSVLIRVLSDTGVLTEQAQKLISVKGILKQALHQANSRHQAELADVYRKVDNIIG